MIIEVLNNYGADHQEPKTIIIHAMGEYIGGLGWENHAANFLNENGLSAHSLIAPENTLQTSINYRCRNDEQGAYHAKGHNTDSLGLEFLVKGEHTYATFLEAMKTDYITEEQYQVGLVQVREWLNKWPIKRIIRHSDISPERKVDPGIGFPWKQFLHDIGNF